MKTASFLFPILLTSVFQAVAAPACHEAHRTTTLPDVVWGFNPSFVPTISDLVAQSQWRPRVQAVQGFNLEINDIKAPRLEKLVRQETPVTVRYMGEYLVRKVNTKYKFHHVGLVIGDPHDGNFNTQANVFSTTQKMKNRYTVVDLDEMSVGVFSADFARYLVYLTAREGDLTKKFGPEFVDELFTQYVSGLKQESPAVPKFISQPLEATPTEITTKLSSYASSRVDSNGFFLKKSYEDGTFAPFKTGQMKPDFLKRAGYKEINENSKKDFKNKLKAFLTQEIEKDFPGTVEVLDFAIPLHESGGSALMQRFAASVRVHHEGTVYPMLIEFKENQARAAWDAVIDSPASLSAADRYQYGIQATMDDPGPFYKVVPLNQQVSLLMRPKGNMDIVPDSDKKIRLQALFNAYLQGRFHGGQGNLVSGPYVQQVTSNFKDFKTEVLQLTEVTLKSLQEESGLKRPKVK